MADLEFIRRRMTENRAFFTAGERYSVAERRRALRALSRALEREKQRIFTALANDLGKSEFEALTSELIPLRQSIGYLAGHLSRLARPRRVGVSLFNLPGSGRVMAEPYGQVLVCGTWNYPLLLALDPLAGAIAAGNRVILTLSPQAPATGKIVAELLAETMPEPLVTVADFTVSPEMLASAPFDKIFFTGGARAGGEVLKLAAPQMTPVILELGGKSPCIVDEDADLKVAARRIVWGKFLNAGQTCVAPDYLLVHSRVKDQLTTAMRDAIRHFWGDDPSQSRDYPRIVNEAHFDRLAGLMDHGRLLAGGEKNRRNLYIAPTIIDQITLEDPVMAQEIFGPILPVIPVASMDEAIALVNARPKPLAMYYFGGRRNRARVLTRTSAGGVCVNDTVMHLVNGSMPFGGVGASGMGCYHGKYSFAAFSHEKPILYKSTWIDPVLRYAPFVAWKRWIADLF